MQPDCEPSPRNLRTCEILRGKHLTGEGKLKLVVFISSTPCHGTYATASGRWTSSSHTSKSTSYHHLETPALTTPQQLPETIALTLLYGATIPYYRYFEFNTLGPIRRLADCNSHPDKQNNLVAILIQWRERKTYELQFVSIAVCFPPTIHTSLKPC